MIQTTQNAGSHSIPPSLNAVLNHGLKPWPHMDKSSMEYLKDLERMKYLKDIELTIQNYNKYLSLLLFIEEYYNEADMKTFDMSSQRITKLNDYVFKIQVPGLTEESSIISVNNLVELIDTKNQQNFKLKIKTVMDEYITASEYKNSLLSSVYKAENLYDVKFLFNNYTYRCSHRALSLVKRCHLTPYLFPSRHKSIPIKYPVNISEAINEGTTNIDLLKKTRWFNKDLENNPEQQQAVLNMINKSSMYGPYVLYGPPGTGKTATVVEAVCQAWTDSSTKRILICTPSNTAADDIVKRLMAYKIPKTDLYRIYSLAYDVSSIDKDIMNCCNCIAGKIKELDAETLPRIIITTLITSMRLSHLNMDPLEFSYVFIDEAGQATEPESLVPFILLSNVKKEYKGRLHGKVILAGDPQQLGPVIRSKLATPMLGKSILERLMNSWPYTRNNKNLYNPRYITKLVRNYRSHPDIISISSSLFYHNELIAARDASFYENEKWEGAKSSACPIIFEESIGEECKDNNSPSAYNADELSRVMHYLPRLIGSKIGDKFIKSEDIGIITPFTTQKVKLRKRLKDIGLSRIETGTVQLFQGREKKIIILSTVRSKVLKSNNEVHLGFLSDPRRFNVAVSRAKSLFIVIGNRPALSTDPHWAYLLDYCYQKNSFIEYKRPINDPFRQLTLKNSNNEKKKQEPINQDHQPLTQHFANLNICRNNHLTETNKRQSAVAEYLKAINNQRNNNLIQIKNEFQSTSVSRNDDSTGDFFIITDNELSSNHIDNQAVDTSSNEDRNKDMSMRINVTKIRNTKKNSKKKCNLL